MSNEVSSCFFKIWINGQELDQSRYELLDSLEIEDCSSGSDLATLVFYDPQLKFLDDNIFIEDATIKIRAGWYLGTYLDFSGYISVIDIDFQDDGIVKITLNCMDKTFIMNKEKVKKTWENCRASDIAKSIFRKYGLGVVVNTTDTVEESISQDDTDISFLLKLAGDQYNDFICYVEGNVGYFIKKPVIANPQATFDYRSGNGEILSFSPRINKTSKQVKVQSSDVDLDSGDTTTSTVNNSLDRDVSGESYSPTNSNSTGNKEQWTYSNGTWTQKK